MISGIYFVWQHKENMPKLLFLQGDRSKNIGVVDSEYLVHKGLPTLGNYDDDKVIPQIFSHLYLFLYPICFLAFCKWPIQYLMLVSDLIKFCNVIKLKWLVLIFDMRNVFACMTLLNWYLVFMGSVNLTSHSFLLEEKHRKLSL